VVRVPGSEKLASIGSDGVDSGASLSRPFQGLVNGGQSRPVVGAKVYVLQANTTGYGDPSVSLLTSRTGNPADSIGYYVRTGEYGGFSIAGDYTCTAGRQVYLYVLGGNSGGNGSNSAIGLMASLGACPKAETFTTAAPFAFVNAVTTVAAASAMVAIATDPTHVSSFETPGASIGMTNAGKLASVTTGFANARPDSKVPQAKIHTFANILSACINSSTPTSTSCNTLFTNARSAGATGAIPADTATAALNIARNPHANVTALYAIQPSLSSPPFLPALESAPPDFNLSPASEGLNNTVASAAIHP
jgi:hypothetical protein